MKHKIKDFTKEFRNGMFLAPSRTYGETYMEPIIRKILGLSESPTGENDALDDNGEFGEIKCSKILIELLIFPFSILKRERRSSQRMGKNLPECSIEDPRSTTT